MGTDMSTHTHTFTHTKYAHFPASMRHNDVKPNWGNSVKKKKEMNENLKRRNKRAICKKREAYVKIPNILQPEVKQCP